jgi:hypothetical protein
LNARTPGHSNDGSVQVTVLPEANTLALVCPFLVLIAERVIRHWLSSIISDLNLSEHPSGIGVCWAEKEAREHQDWRNEERHLHAQADRNGKRQIHAIIWSADV